MASAAIDADPDIEPRPVPRFLSRQDVADRLEIKSVRSLSGTKMPDPDVFVGKHPGWSEETIEEWIATRPGRGRFGQRDERR